MGEVDDISRHVQEIDFTMEEDFLDMLLRMMRDLPLADIYQSGQQPTMAKQLISGEAEAGTRALSVRLWCMQVSDLSFVGPPGVPCCPAIVPFSRSSHGHVEGQLHSASGGHAYSCPWGWPAQRCVVLHAVMAIKALGTLVACVDSQKQG